MKARAVMLLGPREVGIRNLPVPDEIGPDEAILEVEACGMCGTDHEQYVAPYSQFGDAPIAYPYIPGHEMVGRLVRLGVEFARRWGAVEGQRVAVDPKVPCRRCGDCTSGQWLNCTRGPTSYGFTPAAEGSGLHGGFADYMVLRPGTQIYPLPEHLTPQDAVMFNPLGSGFDWACRVGGVGVGDTIVIIGPGQRGLCSVLAAAAAGASRIVVAGRGRHPWKLEMARDLGATHVVDTDETDLATAVTDITNGDLADVVIDTAPATTDTIMSALDCARPEGTIVLAALKNPGGDLAAAVTKIAKRNLVVRGVRSVSEWAKRHAIAALADGRISVERMHTHVADLEEYEHLVRVQGGEVPGEQAMHVTVTAAAGAVAASAFRPVPAQAGRA
ncbi:Threonine dehydrogenase [Pseudonocardia thermophila]|uniref:Threonine dehydrogenase n=1 Tax=Pseudonocardia thermophila TaxID=1848 RepID=A0A1M6QGX8_PSETH|nr:Threonine dehydrogenase [Pseudonocardia thermophila]